MIKEFAANVTGAVGSAVGTVLGVAIGGVTGIVVGAVVGFKLGDGAGREIILKPETEPEPIITVQPTKTRSRKAA